MLFFLRSLTAVLAGVLVCGCASHEPDLEGDWQYVAAVPHLENLPNKIYGDPKLNHFEHVKISGTDTLKMTLTLTSDHRFEWKPFGWTGTWTSKSNLLRLQPKEDYPALRMINGRSETSTHGITDVDMDYHPQDQSLHWTSGSKQFDTGTLHVFVRK